MSPLAFSLRFLQTQSDAQLAALARAGHERAFEALVRRYRRQLLAYCRRVGSPRNNAEDTLQQALLQAWSAIRTGVEVRDPRAWLYRIVHNVAVSDQRRPVVVPIELGNTAGAKGADLEAEQRMAARDALAGLAALPDLQREVMVGTAVDGMSHEELASALGLSSGAVRGLIYRARATLRAAAAAVTPGPVISWALRAGSGPSSVYETLAGGGSVGIGGLLAKGGVIAATAGAIATATGITIDHKAPPGHRATPAAAAAQPRIAGRAPLTSAASNRVLVANRTGSAIDNAPSAGTVTVGGTGPDRGSGDHSAGFTGRSSSGERRDQSGSRAGFAGVGHGGSDGGSELGPGPGPGRPASGADGGSHSGSESPPLSGGSPGGDHSGTISGTDGPTSPAGATSPDSGSALAGGSSRDGGSSGSGSSGGGSTAATISSVDGGGTTSGDGGSATTAATPTASPTVSGSDGSSGGS